ncbi:MAG: GTPase-activating protein, partial [Paramarteilia canceri]
DVVKSGEIMSTKFEMWNRTVKDKLEDYKKFYAINKMKETKYDSEIMKDISRTYPETIIFKSMSTQMVLFHVTRAYCNFDDEIGYTQGMCYPVGALLKSFDETMSFCIFCFIMNDLKMKYMYEVEKNLLNLVSEKFNKVLKVIDNLFSINPK